ncbi:MAG: hypothetical protein ACRDZX_05815, partial [Acidimicrobiales bacterium]
PPVGPSWAVRVKLDENLPADAADVLRAKGHDVETAAGEGLAGRQTHNWYRRRPRSTGSS